MLTVGRSLAPGNRWSDVPASLPPRSWSWAHKPHRQWTTYFHRALPAAFLIAVVCVGQSTLAQNPAAAPPAAAPAPNSNSSLQPAQPLSPTDKFDYAIRHSLLSPMAYLKASAVAGLSMASDFSGDRAYGMGADGFARRWGDRMCKATVTELAGSWIAASTLRQDPRYHLSADPRLGGRLVYAASRVFITRGDNGDSRFNSSNLIGIAAGVGAAITWNPTKPVTSGRFLQSFGESIAVNALSKIAREFLRRQRKP